MKELNKQQKLAVLQYLEDMPYKGNGLCGYVIKVIYELYPRDDDDDELYLDEVFPEVDKIIMEEGNKKAGHRGWIVYSLLFDNNGDARAFREEVLQKIINLKEKFKEKRYCKGCCADVTTEMFCFCGEFPLSKESTYSQEQMEAVTAPPKPKTIIAPKPKNQ